MKMSKYKSNMVCGIYFQGLFTNSFTIKQTDRKNYSEYLII